MLGRSRDHTLKALLAAIIVYVIPPLHPTRYSAMTANTDMPSLAPRRARHPTRARNRPSTATWPSSSSQSLASHVSPSYFLPCLHVRRHRIEPVLTCPVVFLLSSHPLHGVDDVHAHSTLCWGIRRLHTVSRSTARRQDLQRSSLLMVCITLGLRTLFLVSRLYLGSRIPLCYERSRNNVTTSPRLLVLQEFANASAINTLCVLDY